jgi:hypothetical protein
MINGSYNKENTKLKAKEIRESRQIRQVISSLLFPHDAIVVLHEIYWSHILSAFVDLVGV